MNALTAEPIAPALAQWRGLRRTVDQVAWSVGYEDAAAFRKLFHRLTGLSPHEYRQRFATPQSLAEVA